jgi:RHS repeat-associated protein
MKKDISLNYVVRVFFTVVFLSPAIGSAQQINGEQEALEGQVENYTYTGTLPQARTKWIVNGSGSQIIQEINRTEVQVQWGTSGTADIGIYQYGYHELLGVYGWLEIERLYVNVLKTVPTPPKPIIVSSNSCGDQIISKSSTPPAGISWYWRKELIVPVFELFDYPATSNLTVDETGTYYLFAYESATNRWSTGYSSINVQVSHITPGSISGSQTICKGDVLESIVSKVNASDDYEPINYLWKWRDYGSSTWTVAPGVNNQSNYSPSQFIGSKQFIRTVSNAVCGELTSNPVTITVNEKPSAPSISKDLKKSRCGAGTLRMSPTASSNSTGLRWYYNDDDAQHFSIAQYLDVNLSNSKKSVTYYVSSYNSSTNCESGKIAYNVLMNDIPAEPSVSSSSRCGSGLVNFSASPGANGDIVKWYNYDDSSSPLFEGTSFSPNLTQSRSYYVSTYNSTTGCESSRKRIQATINAVPAKPVMSDVFSCGAGDQTVELAPSSGADMLRFYSSMTDNTYNYQRTSLSKPITQNENFFVTNFNSSTGCESEKTSFSTIINPLPAQPNVTDGEACANESAYLNAGLVLPTSANSSDYEIIWYNALEGGSIVDNTNSSTYEHSLSYSKDYFVTVRNKLTGCESYPRKKVRAIVHPSVAAPVVEDVALCASAYDIPVLSPGVGGDIVKWYSSNSKSDLLYTNNKFPDPITSSRTLFVSTYNTTTECESNLVPYAITLNEVPVVDAGETLVIYEFEGNTSLMGSGESPANGTFSHTYIGNNNFDATQSGPGTFTVTYSYSNGVCDANDTKQITVLNNPEIVINGTNDIVWGEGRTLSAPSGFASYQWYKDNEAIAAATSNEFLVEEPGAYHLVVTADSEKSFTLAPAEIINAASQQNENFVQTIIYKAPRKVGEAVRSIEEVNESFTYYDGLGRPVQELSTQASPSKNDLIKPIEYDDFGRVEKEYLPYTASKKDGVFDARALNDENNLYESSSQYQFYAGTEAVSETTKPFSKVDYEASPLNRPIAQYAPGEAWAKDVGNKPLTTQYLFNGEEDALDIQLFEGSPALYGYNTKATLNKTLVTDENGNQSATYTDAFGKTILKRNYIAGETADTYYVYDELDNLVAVLPPELMDRMIVTSGAIPTQLITDFAFQYKYDDRNRMVEKKVPGADWVHMVYDDRDRLVLTQDANQRLNDEWLFTKYDALNRPVATGKFKSALPREEIEELVSNFYESQLNWTGSSNIDFSEGKVIKTSGSNSWGNAGAHQVDFFKAGENAKVSILAGKGVHHRAFGLSHSHTSYNFNGIAYNILLRSNSELEIYENGISRGTFGDYLPEDVLSIERIGTTLNYYKNDILLHSTSATSGPLTLEGAIVQTGDQLQFFDHIPYEQLGGAYLDYTNNSFPQNIKSIDLLTATYYDNYDFFHGEQTDYQFEHNELNKSYNSNVRGQVTGSITRVLRDEEQWLRSINYYDDKYRLIQSLTDNHTGGIDRISNKYDFVGNILSSKTQQVRPAPIVYINQVNAKSLLNGFVSTGAGWDSHVATLNQLSASSNGFITTIYENVTARFFFGFTADPMISQHQDITYKSYVNNGNLYAYYGGKNNYVTNLNIGDTISLTRTDGIVNLELNSEIVYSWTNASSIPLHMIGFIYGGNSLNNISTNLQIPESREAPYNIYWNSFKDMNYKDGILSKVGNGWDTNASSYNILAPGKSGYFEFVANEGDINGTVGLSDKDMGLGQDLIDFAFRLKPDGQLAIIENGTEVQSIGTYQAGDKFRISRNGKTVYYEKNDNWLYTSAETADSKLLVDLAVLSAASSLSALKTSFFIYPPKKEQYTITENFTYDHADRLMEVTHAIEQNPLWSEGRNIVIDNHGEISLRDTNVSGEVISDVVLHDDEDGYIFYEVEDINNAKHIGFNIPGTSNKYYMQFSGKHRLVVVRKNGLARASFSYKEGDRLKILKRGEDFIFIQNGDVKTILRDLASNDVNVFVELNGPESRVSKLQYAKEQLMVSNEYNELGQLIKKNLHLDSPPGGASGAGDFTQSVDYRYNIRGWLTRINKADLSPDGAEQPDLFGMEMGYTDNLSLTGADAQYNGNIAAIKWASKRNITGDVTNPTKQSAYGYNYDALNRITNANFFEGANHNQNQKYQLEIPSNGYDMNGNIMFLKRNDESASAMDQLEYSYAGNQLTAVYDASENEAGFKDGHTGSDDYTYDGNGNMTQDLNKGITEITYNHLNLPAKVTFENGDYINYIYDASGIKLRQEVFKENSLEKSTDYLGAMIFQNDSLQFIQTSEGRLVPRAVEHSEGFEYQYHLKDHLGNVRTTFAVRDNDFNTSFEQYNPYFDNYDQIAIETTVQSRTGAKANKLVSFGEAADRIGITKTFLVSEGDRVNASVYAKYVDKSSSGEEFNSAPIVNALAAMLSGGVLGGENAISTAGVENGLAGLAASGTTDDAYPEAYFNYILFDKSLNFVDAGFKQVKVSDDGTGSAEHELLEFESITIPQDGYIMIFVSNESEELTEVYFDDLMINHHKTELIQADDYYPGGLTFNSYQRSFSKANNYKYNGKELQEETQLYDYGARFYDPALMRFSTIDPMSAERDWLTPYNYVQNNPILRIDPTGMIDDYYNRDGEYLYTDNKTTDYIKIIDQADFDQISEDNVGAMGDRSETNLALQEDLENNSVGINEAGLSDEAASNVYTDILSKMEGVDVGNLFNGKVSIFNYKSDLNRGFNSPNTLSSNTVAGTTKKGVFGKFLDNASDGTIKVTVNFTNSQNKYLNTTTDVRSLLGDHEFVGHGVKEMGGFNNKHKEVYRYQMSQPAFKSSNLSPGTRAIIQERFNSF